MGRPLTWYWRRLRRMSAGEIALRARDTARRTAWRRRQVHHGEPWPVVVTAIPRSVPARLAPEAAGAVPEPAKKALLEAADDLLDGHLEVLGVRRDDLVAPDWFLDPISGRRAPQGRYCFAIDHRSEAETGNVKQVWELSRHHHLTTLAAAWFVSRDERYAEAVDRQLRHWWRENPFLSGVHWTSGIEIGIRLLSWAWIRRLLDTWPGVPALFEANDEAAAQIAWHQRYLAAFPSAGTSANNHVIAEAAGQLVASCAFPWFAESQRWRKEAAALLERELAANTFPSGVNRELASDYHCLVAELGLVAAVEAGAAGHPLSEATWTRLCRMVDAAAAMVDERAGPPRQGDGDDGRVLLVDAPEDNHWPSLLAAGASLFGSLPWWPPEHHRPADARSTLLSSLTTGLHRVGGRPDRRPSSFDDAGSFLLRTPPEDGPEIWCRCDGGPHGFLAIAAHAHADALAVEVRHGGVDVLADPGTYCYHGDPAWRSYFRSTIGHNTLELEHQDQSVAGGPFLWVDHATTRVVDVVRSDGELVAWTAEHDGYRRLDPPAVHRRTVTLDRAARSLTIVDRVETEVRRRCRLAFHLGPKVEAALEDGTARLTWPAASGAAGGGAADLCLPGSLAWSVHRGETSPVLGWYSAGFGRKEPAVTLVGTGWLAGADGPLETILRFEVGR